MRLPSSEVLRSKSAWLAATLWRDSSICLARLALALLRLSKSVLTRASLASASWAAKPIGRGIDGEQLVAGWSSWPSMTAMRTTLPDTSGVISTFWAPT